MYASTWDKVLLLKLKFGMTPKWHTLKNMKPTVIMVGFIAYLTYFQVPLWDNGCLHLKHIGDEFP